MSNDPNPPQVHSISYGSYESYVSSSAYDTFNTEAQKLGVQGVTIFVSSGDDGVSNYDCSCGLGRILCGTIY